MVCGTRTIPVRNAAEGYVYLSTDYGQTWREVLVDASTKWVSEHSCAFGLNQQAYFLSSRSAFYHGLPHHDQGRSRLYSSTDDGSTWRETTDWPFIDFSSTAVDLQEESTRRLVFIFANDLNTNDPESGPGLLTYAPGDSGTLHSLLMAKESRYGKLFSAGPTASAVLDDGSAIAAFSISRSSQTGSRPWAKTSAIRQLIEAVRSDDKGLSLNQAVPISSASRFGQLSESTMAIDRSLSRYRGRIYVSWAQDSTRQIEIMLATSDDGGRSWHRRKIRSLPDRPRELGFGSSPGITPPSVAVNKDGIVGIFWVEKQGRCPYFAASLDGGYSFKAGSHVGACSRARSHDLAWYGHYLFTWPESEANEQGVQRDESRVGVRLEMRVQSLTPTSMVADDHGDFHPMWLAVREGGSELRTSVVNVTSESGIAPKLPPGLTDISSQVALEFANNRFDAQRETFSVDVMVVNRGRVPLKGPLLLQVLQTKSTLGTLRLGENPKDDAESCQWTQHSRLIVQHVLAPEHWSVPVRLSAELHHVRRTDAGDINVFVRVCGYDEDHEQSSPVGATRFWMVTPEHQ